MDNLRRYFTDSSVISLLFSNIIIIVLSIVQGWEITTVLWTYWIQSVIIGLFNFLRILSLKKFSTENFTINNQPALLSSKTKFFTAFFFAFHYGFFHFIYAIFLFQFFSSGPPLDLNYLFLGGLIFFLNHFFSYLHNKIIDEKKLSIPVIGIAKREEILITSDFKLIKLNKKSTSLQWTKECWQY